MPTALTRFEGTFLAVSSECMEKENKEKEEYMIWHSFVPALGDQGGTCSHPGGARSSWGRYHFWFLSQAQASTSSSLLSLLTLGEVRVEMAVETQEPCGVVRL